MQPIHSTSDAHRLTDPTLIAIARGEVHHVATLRRRYADALECSASEYFRSDAEAELIVDSIFSTLLAGGSPDEPLEGSILEWLGRALRRRIRAYAAPRPTRR